MVYLDYIAYLRYTILVPNPRNARGLILHHSGGHGEVRGPYLPRNSIEVSPSLISSMKPRKASKIKKSRVSVEKPLKTWFALLVFLVVWRPSNTKSVSLGSVWLNNFKRCHTETEVANQTCQRSQSLHCDSSSAGPSTDPIAQGYW